MQRDRTGVKQTTVCQHKWALHLKMPKNQSSSTELFSTKGHHSQFIVYASLPYWRDDIYPITTGIMAEDQRSCRATSQICLNYFTNEAIGETNVEFHPNLSASPTERFFSFLVKKNITFCCHHLNSLPTQGVLSLIPSEFNMY